MSKAALKFWEDRAFWMQLVAAAVFLAIALTQTVVFTSGQVLLFVLGLSGIATGSVAATNVANAFAGRAPAAAPSVTVLPAAPAPSRAETPPEPNPL